MDKKIIGIILIVASILLGFMTYNLKEIEQSSINTIIMSTNSCFLDDGTCLHEDDNTYSFILGFSLALVLLIIGIYLIFFDNTEKKINQQNEMIIKALENTKKEDKYKNELNAFLSGFSEDEQKILKIIYEQDGIKQSTIRYKTNMSKSTISLILKSLEERKYVKRIDDGKTKKVYFIKKF